MVRSFFIFFLLFVCSISWLSFPAYASDLKINEVLVHPGTTAKEWIEFYNPDKSDISSYYIDDDTDFVNDIGSAKKILSNLQGADTEYPYFELTSSMFNNDGDAVVLFDASGTIIDQYTYTKDPGENSTLGRNPNGTGDFAVLEAATKGSENAPVQSTPTLSPTKIPTPTHTPTPSHTLTPTRTPTATKISAPSPTSKITQETPPKTETTTLQKKLTTKNNISIDTETASITATAASHEAVLYASISSKPKISKTPKLLVKSAQKFNSLSLLFSVGGGACLIACGILIYWKTRK